MKTNQLVIIFLFSGLIFSAEAYSSEVKVTEMTTSEIKQLTDEGLKEWGKDNLPRAFELLGKADKAGSIPATIALAQIFHSSDEFEIAFPLLKKASQAGDNGSSLRLVDYYNRGLGIKKANFVQGKKLLDKLLVVNFLPARMYQAEMFEYGRFGAEKDLKLARTIYLELANKAFRPAMLRLNTAYRQGELDLKQNRAEAQVWLTRATNISPEKNSGSSEKGASHD